MKVQNGLILLGMLLACTAFAAQETYDLQRMVVTPSRGAQKDILDIPQSISVLSADELASSVRVDLQDYLQEIPGITMAPSGTTGRTSSNNANRNSDYFNSGFSIRGLGGQRVLLLTDGIRQSGQGMGYGGGNLSLYDIFAIEKVEILKGPGSVVYGTDAFGGVVNIISHTPKVRQEKGLNGRMRVSYDDSRNAMSLGGLVDVGDEGWGIVAGASTTEANDPSLPDGLQPTGGSYTKNSGFVKAQLRPTEDSTLTFTANVTEAKDIDIYQEDGAPYNGNFLIEIPFYQRKMAGVEYVRNDISDRLKQYRISLSTQELNRRMIRQSPYFPPYDFSVYERIETDDTVHTHELHTNSLWELGDRHNVTVGADLGYDTNHLMEMHGLTTGSMSHRQKADATQLRFGLYAQDQINIERHSFTLGVRGDYFDLSDDKNNTDTSDEGLSGSLGCVYHLDDQTSLFSTVATGFRSPDLDERYQDTTVNYFTEQVTVQGNADLDPERSYSFEAGVKRDSEDGRWEAAAYYNAISDYIGETLLSSTPAGPRTIIVKQRNNVGDVSLYGIEAGWSSPKASSWRNYANVYRTWTDAPDIVPMADWRFAYGVGYRFTGVGSFKSVTPSWAGRYATASYDALSSVYFPAYHTVDLQVAVEWGDNEDYATTFVLGVRNLFDKRYYEPFMSTAQPGRGFFASLDMKF